jgi:hypothetical protein
LAATLGVGIAIKIGRMVRKTRQPQTGFNKSTALLIFFVPHSPKNRGSSIVYVTFGRVIWRMFHITTNLPLELSFVASLVHQHFGTWSALAVDFQFTMKVARRPPCHHTRPSHCDFFFWMHSNSTKRFHVSFDTLYWPNYTELRVGKDNTFWFITRVDSQRVCGNEGNGLRQ